jgi:D-tyrosyl-tRNA(Tyr) deacylase
VAAASRAAAGGTAGGTAGGQIVIALLQRVSEAAVDVDGRRVGAIGRGLMVLVCAERGDGEREAERLLAKLLAYRVFPDDEGRMNRSVRDLAAQAPAGAALRQAGLLLVPQFTLAADTNSGTRPSFTPAAAPADGRRLFEHFVGRARTEHPAVETGIFGANMKVSLVNDGPVTFWLRIAPTSSKEPA